MSQATARASPPPAARRLSLMNRLSFFIAPPRMVTVPTGRRSGRRGVHIIAHGRSESQGRMPTNIRMPDLFSRMMRKRQNAPDGPAFGQLAEPPTPSTTAFQHSFDEPRG